MKKVKVENAIGMTLCHDITAMYDGFKGPIFKRGHIIEEKDVDTLLKIGKEHIFIFEKDVNEIHEEDAATRLMNLNKIKNATYTDVSEGKITAIANVDGMFTVNTDLLRRINSIDDITISTLPNHYPVKKGMKISNMRIVPLVTDKKNILDAEKIVKESKDNNEELLYDIKEYKNLKVGVCITGSEIYKGRIKDKFEPVCREKLSHFPSEIIDVKFSDDDENMIKDIASDFINKGADLIIFTGGMSVDPDDVTPSAIRNLGAEIITHGVPAQPGNMTLVAYKDDVAMLGIPGAAISMKTTIFDVLLPQIFTKIKFTKNDLINLAAGGTCQLCADCHFPNCTFGRY